MKPAYSFLFFFTNTFLTSVTINGEETKVEKSLSEEKIIGGIAVGSEYPWLTALYRGKKFGCGASLIGSKVVLTAAHCYDPYLSAEELLNYYTVKLGLYDICQKEEIEKSFNTKKVIIHEKYSNDSLFYDIALLILDDTADFTQISLPSAGQTVPSYGTAVGWGATYGKKPRPTCILREAKLKIYQFEDEHCTDSIKSLVDPNAAYGVFCAGYLQGRPDTCRYDSGGPLQFKDEDGNFIILGIIAWGNGCAEPGKLGIYTNLSMYIDWIEEKLKDSNESL